MSIIVLPSDLTCVVCGDPADYCCDQCGADYCAGCGPHRDDDITAEWCADCCEESETTKGDQ